jgi:hypothetical protein
MQREKRENSLGKGRWETERQKTALVRVCEEEKLRIERKQPH